MAQKYQVSLRLVNMESSWGSWVQWVPSGLWMGSDFLRGGPETVRHQYGSIWINLENAYFFKGFNSLRSLVLAQSCSSHLSFLQVLKMTLIL